MQEINGTHHHCVLVKFTTELNVKLSIKLLFYPVCSRVWSSAAEAACSELLVRRSCPTPAPCSERLSCAVWPGVQHGCLTARSLFHWKDLQDMAQTWGESLLLLIPEDQSCGDENASAEAHELSRVCQPHVQKETQISLASLCIYQA